jgi:hypothetical protein
MSHLWWSLMRSWQVLLYAVFPFNRPFDFYMNDWYRVHLLRMAIFVAFLCLLTWLSGGLRVLRELRSSNDWIGILVCGGLWFAVGCVFPPLGLLGFVFYGLLRTVQLWSWGLARVLRTELPRHLDSTKPLRMLIAGTLLGAAAILGILVLPLGLDFLFVR